MIERSLIFYHITKYWVTTVAHSAHLYLVLTWGPGSALGLAGNVEMRKMTSFSDDALLREYVCL